MCRSFKKSTVTFGFTRDTNCDLLGESPLFLCLFTCSLKLTFTQHFCDSLLFNLTAAPLFQINKYVFFRSCAIKTWPVALESPIQPGCGGVAVFTTSWWVLSKCQVLYVCDLCFDVSLPFFFIYCLSVLTALVKGHYNLQGEPAMHLERIKKLFCFSLESK